MQDTPVIQGPPESHDNVGHLLWYVVATAPSRGMRMGKESHVTCQKHTACTLGANHLRAEGWVYCLAKMKLIISASQGSCEVY